MQARLDILTTSQVLVTSSDLFQGRPLLSKILVFKHYHNIQLSLLATLDRPSIRALVVMFSYSSKAQETLPVSISNSWIKLKVL